MIRWMSRQFSRGQCEDQPPAARVDGVKAKDIPEEGACSLDIARIEDGMDSCDHWISLGMRAERPNGRAQGRRTPLELWTSLGFILALVPCGGVLDGAQN